MSCPASSPQAPPAAATIYRPRRPARTLLHKVIHTNLETYLAGDLLTDEPAAHVPRHGEAAYRYYLKCGNLAHGFAQAHCAGCGHDFLIAFSCKGRDVCPSCATRRMVETAAHIMDDVLPARSPPQTELDFNQVDQTGGGVEASVKIEGDWASWIGCGLSVVVEFVDRLMTLRGELYV